ncbi:MAG: fatty acid desaturase [Ignavibacteria bacterium]
MGIIIAVLIIIVWASHLFYCLSSVRISPDNVFMYFHILLQIYFYTGLFITAHDSMHGNVSKNKRINLITGNLCTFLFAGLSYKKLLKNHWSHHLNSGTQSDPDYYSGSNNLFIWWAVFLKRYVTVMQIVIMASEFNILKIFFPELSVWIFLVMPAVLSTFQLFFFGTYLPHRQPHTHNMLPHNSRTQSKNHIIAMLSCYFFGYHSEHHSLPKTPWWQLYKMK